MKFFSDFFHILKDLTFAEPNYFWWLLLLIPLIGWQIWKRHQQRAPFVMSSSQPFSQAPQTWKTRFYWLPNALRIIVIVFIIIALARPQSSFHRNQVEVEGVDIVMALDISGSMKMMDFKPNRLEACKKVATEFIEGRPTDRIGLVVYAGEAYTQCPLTTDHNTLLGLMKSVKFDLIEDGTAIGDGLGTAINRLRESEAKSKIIILLSDGVNNSGYLDPESTAEMAKDFGIKVYTIGCGTNGQAPYPTPRGNMYVQTEIDEQLLTTIANKTGGQYFRATNNKKLEEVYNEIDKMEKTIINEAVFENKSDEYKPFLIFALFFFALELIFSYLLRLK
ncbi:MAG: VWA domain-containing protein [Bacteroidales bacterium]|nr:VWA domain-containing protein [Bacteroidales bacterium]